jgi:DNA-binding LacI/PurR family transcriptional regulator/signal transduction histidine kinase
MNLSKSTSPDAAITFGILTDYVADYHRQILRGIQATLERAGVGSVVFVGTDLTGANLTGANLASTGFFAEANAAYDLVSPRLSGLIALAGSMGPTLSDAELLGFLARFAPMPLVSVGRVLPSIPSVISHSASGMNALMQHLIDDCGYTRFAFMRGFVGESDSDARERVVRQVLLANGLELQEKNVLTGEYFAQQAYGATRNWLLQHHTGHDHTGHDHTGHDHTGHDHTGHDHTGQVQVIVSASDDMALGVLQALEEAGINVPEDMALTGFDDIAISSLTLPSLTTVRQPLFELGVRAAQTLLESWQNQRVDLVTDLPCKLVVRESSRPILKSVALETSSLPELNRPELNRPELNRPKLDLPELNSPETNSPGLETLRDQFRHAVNHPGETGQSFLRTWRDWMRSDQIPNHGPRYWQDVLRSLLTDIPSSLESQAVPRAVSLWGRAHSLTLSEGQLLQQRRQLNEQGGLSWLHDFDDALMTDASIPAVMRNLVRFLPDLGVERCYVALFETYGPSICANAHLVLAYEHAQSLPLDGTVFASHDLLPTNLQDRLGQPLYLQPIFLNDEQYGFMTFGLSLEHSLYFETLRQILSGGIHNAVQAKRLSEYTTMLEERIQERTEQLAQQTTLTLENAQLNAQLRDQLARIDHSQRLAVEAEERTRREIAEFLHGQVQTRLLLAWNQLCDYPITPEDARAQLIENVRDDLERIRKTDVRQASHVLHPSVIRMGLVSATRSLASRMTEVLPVRIEVSDEFATLDVIGASRLPEDVRLIAYRVIEEAISNSLKHAKATRVKVHFSQVASDAFEVIIRDDGQGFESTQLNLQRSRGLGFASIDARVHAVQGTWKVISRVGGPTEITVRLPLAPNAATEPQV